MITIKRRCVADGTYYEIPDFDAYASALLESGLDRPQKRYRIFVSHQHEASLRAAVGDDLENQIALLFRLSPASGITYQFETFEN